MLVARGGGSSGPDDGGRRTRPPHDDRLAGGGPIDVHLFPLPLFCGCRGSSVLDAIHEEQQRHPIRELWEPSLRLPRQLLDYVCSVCADYVPHVRQQAVLLLKRYIYCKAAREEGKRGASMAGTLQVVALSCVHLSLKNWQQKGISEQKLHWLSRNNFTRKDFMAAEVDVLETLGGVLQWEGALLAEWTALLMHLAAPLLAAGAGDEAGEGSPALLGSVASLIADVLAFQDDVMSEHLPSELAAAALHTSAMLCSKQFQRYALTLHIGHLARTSEEQVVRLSEQILSLCIGHKYAEHILEGSGFVAEDSDEDLRGEAPPASSAGRRGGRGRGAATSMATAASPPSSPPSSPRSVAAKRRRRG